MKNFFKYIGLFSVVCFSFFMTHNTANMLKNVDEIMIKIKDSSDQYTILKKEAIIDNDKITPGINGSKVNINKSYNYMKKVGVFDPNLFIYDDVKVSYEIQNNLDKYIINGNKSKKMVSIFIYLNQINLDSFISKIGDTKINFIVTKNDLEEKYNEIISLINNGHNIILLDINNSTLSNYKDIKTKTIQKNMYCFNEDFDNSKKDICASHNAISINAQMIDNNYFKNIKTNLSSGSFILLKGNPEKEINTIINYIISKGYKISNIDIHIDENY